MALLLTDQTANGNTLTNNGAAETADTPFAASTAAADLESSESDNLSAADSASLSLVGDFTFECWVKWESLPASGSFMAFLGKWQVATNKSYSFKLKNTSGTYSLQIEISGDGSISEVLNKNITTPTLGTYYHYAVSWVSGASPLATYYIDGVSQGTTAGTTVTAIFNTAISFLIGVEETTGYLDGIIDEVRIWNVVRTATQIADNRSIELIGNETGLQAYWPFDSIIVTTTSTSTSTTSTSTSTSTTSTSTSTTSTSTSTTSTSSSTSTSTSTSSSTSTSTTSTSTSITTTSTSTSTTSTSSSTSTSTSTSTTTTFPYEFSVNLAI